MIDAKLETIGPDQAKQILRLNTENFRKPDKTRVDSYAKEMLSGNWQINGDTIKINGRVLLDGQHRLMAIVKSKVSIQTIVVRGLETDGKTIDRGKPRSISQWCSHNGIKNAKIIASSAKLCVAYEKGMWGKKTIQANDIIDSEIFDFIENNNTGLQFCVRAAVRVKVVSGSMLAALLYVGCEARDPMENEMAAWFCKALSTGENLTEEDSVLHLRNKLISQKPQSRMDAFMQRALLTIAWNNTVAGEPCSAFGFRLRLTGPAKQKAPTGILTAST